MTTSEKSNDAVEPDRLDLLRRVLDDLDRNIVGIVAIRTEITVAIGEEKRQRGLPTYVPTRHGEVVQNYVDAIPEGSSMQPADAVALSEAVQAVSRGAQDRAREQVEADMGMPPPMIESVQKPS